MLTQRTRDARLYLEHLEDRRLLVVPNFTLVDVNTNSPLFEQSVSPHSYADQVSVWYFTKSYCGYCRSLVTFLDQMEKELAQHKPSLGARMFGVNAYDAAGLDVDLITEPMPFLQDVAGSKVNPDNAWTLWDAEWRDVFVVDRQSNMTFKINLTANPLSNAQVYETLKNAVIEAGRKTPTSAYQSAVEPLDVNNDDFISPIDALLVINDLSKYPGGALPPLASGANPSAYIDINGDGFVSPLDALAVINHLSRFSARAALSSSADEADTADLGMENVDAASAIPSQFTFAITSIISQTRNSASIAQPSDAVEDKLGFPSTTAPSDRSNAAMQSASVSRRSVNEPCEREEWERSEMIAEVFAELWSS